MTHTDILIFCEDPGGTNYVSELPATLRGKGWRIRVLAEGAAREVLARRGLVAEAVPQGTTAEDVIAVMTPRLVMVGTSENPDTLGLKLVAAARAIGIPTAGVVDALINATYRFRGRGDQPLGFAPDFILVPDGATRDAFAALGHPPQQTVICGHPVWDEARRVAAELARRDRVVMRRKLFPGVRDDQAIVIFLAEISDGFDPSRFRRAPDYRLNGRGTSDLRTNVVIEEMLDALAPSRSRVHFALRLHPKNRKDEFVGYHDEIDQMSTGGDAHEIVFFSDLVVGMTSSLLQEAALMRRPTLAVLPRPSEAAWLQATRAGAIPVVCEREALSATFGRWLAGQPPTADRDIDEVLAMDSTSNVVAVVETVLSAQGTGR